MSDLITRLRDPDYAGVLQHCRSSSEIHTLLHAAANLIESQGAALEPFATACENCDEGGQDDDAHAWESPMAMAVTYGDFRKAASTLQLIQSGSDVPIFERGAAGVPVERAIAEVNGRFTNWTPTPVMIGYARAVAAAVQHLAVDEAEIHSILERGVAGERLSASERSAWTGYEIGWRDGHQRLAASGWREIATAPKDGTYIDLWVEGEDLDRTAQMNMVRGRWGEETLSFPPEMGWLTPLSVVPEHYVVTHWKPLPDAPNLGDGAQDASAKANSGLNPKGGPA